jgi:hypothetical protein
LLLAVMIDDPCYVKEHGRKNVHDHLVPIARSLFSFSL